MGRSRLLRTVSHSPTLTDDQRSSDEHALMRAVACGDEQAFADLYDLVAPRVHGIVLRVVRDPAQAEEVTQEVMVELWRLAPRFDGTRGSLAAWTAAIAHRRAVDRVRSVQAARDRDDRDVAATVAGSRGADDVGETVGGRLEQQRVRHLLSVLTPLQRECVELAYFSGYTYREVAVLLDAPEGTVKTRIRDGLSRLRDAMEGTR